MKITIRRVYDFGRDAPAIGADLLTPAAWDAARETEGPFAIAASMEEWERAGATPSNMERARQIVELARELGAHSLCSYGVGGALIEQQIHRLDPGLRLVCADFAPRTVERLQVLFPEVDVIVRDLSTDGPLPADVHLMHRLDAELSDEGWRRVFELVRSPVIFVPCTVLSSAEATKELVRRLLRPSATFAGWFRNEAALRALWAPWFDDRPVTIGCLRGFVLLPRGGR